VQQNELACANEQGCDDAGLPLYQREANTKALHGKSQQVEGGVEKHRLFCCCYAAFREVPPPSNMQPGTESA